MSGETLLTLYNNHAESCGTPPQLTNRMPEAKHKYFGYFENEHAEQWVFVYDLDTEEAVLKGGDDGWEHEYHMTEDGRIVDGDGDGLMLDESEKSWLRSCYAAATAFKEGREDRRRKGESGHGADTD